ncbi:MAG: hypothetical protein II387_03695 [Oscillospiraceae bacterium]|nr:hypothetical protein [Oscillospiraceae bacterium]
MKCFYHPEEETVASCVECGKGLCKTCADMWQPARCDECAENKIAEERRELYRPLGLGIIIFFAFMVLAAVVCASKLVFRLSWAMAVVIATAAVRVISFMFILYPLLCI